MFSKISLIACGVLFFVSSLRAQDCALRIDGQVLDGTTQLPLAYVSVYMQERGLGVYTDLEGNFTLTDVCAEEYHLLFSHIGCESEEISLEISRDTFLTVRLSHSAISLERVIIQESDASSISQASGTVKRQAIEDGAHKSIADLLEDESGVSLLKTGSNLSKPMVHGLYGNRLIMLNHGVPQAGQQWGNDHSPEIDPLTTDKITILKGATSLEYAPGGMGSVVMVEPQSLGTEPHLHGRAHLAYEGNGRGTTANVRLQKASPLLAWSLTGTWKRYGDRRTPDYFLRNTGTREFNLAGQLKRQWNDKSFTDLYISNYSTQIGVLRGSHIGSTNDLKEAIQRDVPFFTEEKFSSAIDAPRQEVNHQLIKVSHRQYFSDERRIEVLLSTQRNERDEYDVRRGGRTDRPTLRLEQWTLQGDLKYIYESHDWNYRLGTQNSLTLNKNLDNTGVLPLIPDYNSWKSGAYVTGVRQLGHASESGHRAKLDMGVRYDYEYQSVAFISRGSPPEVIRYVNQYHNFSSLAGINFTPISKHDLALHIGYAMRNPAVNELYSNGLHQGVSGIEEGDPELTPEASVKATLEYDWTPSNAFSLSVLAYYQSFTNYIYLQPQEEARLTIRGAFPVFTFKQTDASLKGLDLSMKASLGRALVTTVRYSYVHGRDRSQDIPLVYVPPADLYHRITYRSPRSVRILGRQWEQLELQAHQRYVARQSRLLESQDFLAPPDAYYLLGASFSATTIFPHTKVRVYSEVNNLLDTSYRNYLNRQRYFADDLGRSIVLGLHVYF